MEGQQKSDYEVGYGKPPKETQFKKGNKPAHTGRKPSTITGWAKFYGQQKYVSGKITFSKDGKPKTVNFSIRNGEGPINALVALQLIKGAVEGDLYFIKELLDRTEGKAPQTIHVDKKLNTVVQPTGDGGIEILDEEMDDEEGDYSAEEEEFDDDFDDDDDDFEEEEDSESDEA